MGDRRFRIHQLVGAVRIAVERDEASGGHGVLRQLVVESCRDGSPSISMATSDFAAAANTSGQRAVTPGRDPYLRPLGCPRILTPGVATVRSRRPV